MTTSPIPATMAAVRLDAPGLDGLTVEMIQTPQAHAGQALVEVHAAALTRGELEWPVDRLPAIPCYELSGVVVDVADEVERVAVGDAVYALTEFDRDGVAAAYAAVPASLLAPKPSTLDHLQTAAVPLPALNTSATHAELARITGYRVRSLAVSVTGLRGLPPPPRLR